MDKKSIENLKNTMTGTRRKALLVYYRRLLKARRQLIKATLFLSITPIIVLCIMILYGRLSFQEGIYGALAVIICSIFFTKPYMEDLFALTNYVQQLALDRNVKMPPLSLLGNVEELSSAVSNLHHSWENKKIQLEAAVAESSILFDTIPDILMLLSRDLRILRCNKAAEMIFGRSLKNVTFNTIVPDPALNDVILSVMSSKKSESVEIPIISHNVRRDFQINIERFPLSSIGGTAVVLIMHDVTAAKKTRQMLKDFVANASHEIRTPLTSISGFIENLRDMQEDAETRKQFLDIMHEQSERMGVLVNDLLSLSKVEMNESTIPTDKVETVALLNSTIRRLEHLAKNKNMTIIYHGESKLPEVLGDANEISQVFTNLISNAIKYGYDNTEITITAAVENSIPESLKHIPKNATKLISVSVTDKGEGIPEDHLPRITERFYRVDKLRNRTIGGTGLGLSIAKHIMNRHRGEIVIESTVGVGSTFTTYFPVLEH